MANLDQNLIKYTGIYRCPDSISNFKIRIKIKEIRDETTKNKEKCLEKVFDWQKKVFSVSEKEFYKTESNCLTDLEKSYHNMILEEENGENGILFCYINDDIVVRNQEKKVYNNYLDEMMQNLSIQDNNSDYKKLDEFDFRSSVVSCVENPILYREYERMEIILDLGEYFQNTWIKNEKILCNIKYEKSKKTLEVYPDFTTTQPYTMSSEKNNQIIKYQYFIENCSSCFSECNFLETELIKKINEYKTSLKKQLLGSHFETPEKNKLQVFLFFEILTARNFEYDIFVEYFIDLPQYWCAKNCENLQGRTQICRARVEEGYLHFGHCFDVVLEYNIQGFKGKDFSKSPCIYFEVLSKDCWDRHRTEGLCYKNLNFSNSGIFCYKLNCFRFVPKSFSGNLRRFFIGDCKNYEDVTWIGIPKEHDGEILNKFGTTTVGTGELSVRLNVVHQSQAFLDEFNENADSKTILDRISSSTLIKTVEEVLRAFKRARKNMLEAKSNV